MSQEAFRLLSRAMRYVFVLIAALFFLLTVIWMRRDQRHWKKNKKQLPDAGTVGDLVDEDSLRRIPVPREGTIGSGGRCDIRIIGRGVRRRHADIRFVDGKGLLIIPARGARILLDGKPIKSPAFAGRDTRLKIGSVILTLKLLRMVDAPARGIYEAEEGEYDPLTAVVPVEDGWSRVIPLPEDRIDGGPDMDRADEDGDDASRSPFEGVSLMPPRGAVDNGGEDETQE